MGFRSLWMLMTTMATITLLRRVVSPQRWMLFVYIPIAVVAIVRQMVADATENAKAAR